MSIRPLENLWNFALDNPEISIFIVTALFGGLTWLFQKSRKPIGNWFRKTGDEQIDLIRPDDELRPQVKIPSPSAQNWFVNVGEHRGHLKWEDCVRYGCISAGGGLRYAKALQKLRPGDTVYAYISGYGYVGGGKVSKAAVPIDRFTTEPHNTPLLKRDLVTREVNSQSNNLELTDWITGIEWFKTFEREQASKDTEHYRSTICRIRDFDTLASLYATFYV